MGIAAVALVAVIFLLSGVRKIPLTHRGVVLRLGKQLPGVRGPGFVWIIPIFDRVQLISIEPYDVSLPPQSAITSDEIPIQLQASVKASLQNPEQATSIKDWRLSTRTTLQNLMKDRLEELDFDSLQSEFPDWVQRVRRDLERSVAIFGVQIQDLQISNLSPRSRPQ
jgi:regulator of protease activity HflC (stomatin/prohibitin superfamily)